MKMEMQNPNSRMGNAEWKRIEEQYRAGPAFIERERKRSEREQRYRETNKGRETLERERQSGNKPSGSGGTLAQACAWKLEMCMCTLDQECAHCTTNLPRSLARIDFRCRICRCILPHPPRSTCPRVACHGSLDIDVEAADKVIAADMALSRNSKMELEAEHGKDRMETQRRIAQNMGKAESKRKRCATKPTRIGNTSSGSGNAETEKE